MKKAGGECFIVARDLILVPDHQNFHRPSFAVGLFKLSFLTRSIEG